MILVDEKLILYFSFKMPASLSLEIFDFSLKKKDLYQMETAIEDSAYIILKMGTDIIKVDRQSDIESKSLEKLLFRVKRDSNFNYLIENPSAINFSEANVEGLNNKLWYSINNINREKNVFMNKDYFICENDILKFGNIKYIVKQINLNSNKEKKEIREINFDFYPSFQNYIISDKKDDKIIKCGICGNSNYSENNPLIKFCNCNYLHFECLKKQITSDTYFKENEKVKNYYIKNLKCKSCDFIFPLRFKLEQRKYELINIETPLDKNIDYIILESIEKKIFFGHMKLIHVIKFRGDKDLITIGRNKKENDMIICDPSVSKEHAILIYDKFQGNILIKNRSKKFGTLAFIKNSINIEKRMKIQIGKILFETERMKMKEFDKIKKKKRTKYPLTSKY